MSEQYHTLTIIGLISILLGFFLVMLPFLSRYLPTMERIPSIIWWTYRKDNFYFATSPILIIISTISLIFLIFGRYIRG